MKRAHRRIALGGLVLLVGLLYGPGLGRYFVSDDFIVLRVLSEASLAETLWAQFTGPWMGAGFINFYRPFSTLLFAGEYQLFGLHPFPYHVVHLLVHMGHAVLVYFITRKLLPGVAYGPALAALLFAVYPLHPNTVLWLSSHGNLFATSGILGACLLFLHALETGRRLAYWGAVGCIAFALGCYESAVIGPLLLVGIYLFKKPDVPFRVWDLLPFGVLLAGYFLIRWSVLGVLVGGYPGIRARLLGSGVGPLALDLLIGFGRMLWPGAGAGPAWWEGLLGAGLLASVLGIGIWHWKKGQSVWLRLGVLGVYWCALAQMVFAVPRVVPANGRFWYLAVVGLVLAIVALVNGLQQVRSVRQGAWVLPAGLAVCWIGMLYPVVHAYAEAGARTRQLQRVVLSHLRDEPPGAPVFLTGHPLMITDDGGTPLAQVFQWGLRDALRPPFTEQPVDLYPLPAMDAPLRPVFAAFPYTVLVWDDTAGKVYPIDKPSAATADTRLEILSPPSDALVPPEATRLQMRLAAPPPGPLVLHLLWAGHPHREPVQGCAAGNEGITCDVPISVFRQRAGLYEAPFYWWVEARGHTGRRLAYSTLHRLTVQPSEE